HYSTAQHALVALRYGDFTSRLASVVSGEPDSGVHPYYLILSVDFWANCFKYHNFGYHVCCEDVGAMLGTLHLAAGSLGVRHESYLAFDDFGANDVIGADGRSESVFAVVGLGSEKALSEDVAADRGALPAVTRSWQRSRRVHIPEELVELHQLTMTHSGEFHSPPREEGTAPSPAFL